MLPAAVPAIRPCGDGMEAAADSGTRSSESFRRLLQALLEEHERELQALRQRLGQPLAMFPTMKDRATRPSPSMCGDAATCRTNHIQNGFFVGEEKECNSIVLSETSQPWKHNRRDVADGHTTSTSSKCIKSVHSEAVASAPQSVLRESAATSLLRIVEKEETPRGLEKLGSNLSLKRFKTQKKSGFALLQMWQSAHLHRFLSTVSSGNPKETTARNSNHKRITEESRRSGVSFERTPSSLDRIRTSLETSFIDACLEPYIITPGSPFKLFWSFGCLFLLVYDICVVPMDNFIGMPESVFLRMMEWTIRIFWSMDLLLNFFTGVFIDGHLEKRISQIVRSYSSSWLIFDITLVSFDWLESGSADWFEGTSTSLLPLLRAVRLLRLLRLLRAAKLQQFFSDILFIAPSLGILQLATCTCFLIHTFACLWYAIGTSSEQGWASYEAIQTASLGRKYILAVHWMETQLHGTSSYAPSSTLEYAFGVFTTFIFFINMTIFISQMTYTVAALKDSHKARLEQMFFKYMKNRKISATLKARLNQYITRSHCLAFNEQVERESAFIMALPQSLQMDLTEEVRKPILLNICFFRELQNVSPRVLRLICFEALTSVVGVRTEYLFLFGGICKRMLCVESGKLHYVLGGKEDDMRALLSAKKSSSKKFPSVFSQDVPGKRASRPQQLLEGGRSTWSRNWASTSPDTTKNTFWVPMPNQEYDIVRSGAYLSEASLYMNWTYRGDFVAVRNSTFVALEASKYHEVVTKQETSSRLAVAYAQQYLAEMDPEKLSDLMMFEVDFSNLSELLDVPSDDYFIFLSHFKQEAGTEAALMADNLEKMITEDTKHPASTWESICFLDSSELKDLGSLRGNVQRSHNLLLLLTPNVLLRPWCLVEIYTAVHASVNVVPVEVQRPGFKFKYPDDTFYEALQKGDVLKQEDVALLQGEGIDIFELVKCIRHVFNKIAVPFSPHKSAHVRQAELDDILARCIFADASDEREVGEDDAVAMIRASSNSHFWQDIVARDTTASLARDRE